MTQLVQLRDVCEVLKGGVSPQRVPEQEFAHYSIPAFDDGMQPVIELGESIKSQKTRIRKGAVLVSKLNPRIPRVWLVNDNCESARISSTEFVPLFPDVDRLVPEYLAFGLRYSLRTGQISGTTSAATKSRERAKPSDIASLALPLPSLAEQRRIVNLLSRAESIVRLRREAQRKAAELIQAIFLDLFGDPAINSKRWSVVPLGDLLAEPPILGTMAKPSAESACWLDLRVANIQNGHLALDDKKWVDLPEDQTGRFSLRDDDVLLARAIGSLDHLGKAIIVHPEGDWTFDSHLMRVRLNHKKLLPIVFKAFLESGGGRKEFLKYTRRSAVQFNINGKELRKIRISLPPIDLQHQFAAKAEAVRGIIVRQTAALATAQATFDALLHRAFAG